MHLNADEFSELSLAGLQCSEALGGGGGAHVLEGGFQFVLCAHSCEVGCPHAWYGYPAPSFCFRHL